MAIKKVTSSKIKKVTSSKIKKVTSSKIKKVTSSKIKKDGTPRKEPFGRPTAYNCQISKEICDRLANGESLNRICEDKHTPSKGTIYNWLFDPKRSDFLNLYTHARDLQSDTFMDECVDIADDTKNDTIILTTKDGKEYEKTNFEHINRSRLRVDTRIKVAEKMAPRKYMSKNRTEITGTGGKELFPQLSEAELSKLSEIMSIGSG